MSPEVGVGLSPEETGEIATAHRAAERVASQAGVVVRPVLDLPGLHAITDLYAGIWRGSHQAPVTTELLRAMSNAGSYVAGAFEGDQLVGACVGFFSEPAAGALHSHIAGVSPTARRRAVGLAMKLHQRAWALGRGVSMIEWTYDPLVARNAYVNIVKLAATPAEYLTNFYGGMGDAINGDDDSDRILVHWHLRDPGVTAAAAGHPCPVDAEALQAEGARIALRPSATGAPETAGGRGTGVWLVAVPRDVESMRSLEPARAREWRVAVRSTLGDLLAGGARITGFDRSGWYVVDQRV